MDRKNLAEVRKLIGQSDPHAVRQGFELARALDDPALWSELADVERRVKARLRKQAQLWLARGSGAQSLALSFSRDDYMDLDALEGWTTLQSLTLYGPLRDLRALETLTGLQNLELRVPVSDLTPLARLTDLRTLDVHGCPVSDLTPLARLPQLRVLSLQSCPVADLSALSRLAALEELDLIHTRVTDLGPLAGLTALKRLDVSGTAVAELAPLSGLSGLRTLRLHGTPVTSLSAVAALPRTHTIDVGSCEALAAAERLAVMRGRHVVITGHAPDIADAVAASLGEVGARVSRAPSAGPDALDCRNEAAVEAFLQRAHALHGDVWAAVHLVTQPPLDRRGRAVLSVATAGSAAWRAAYEPADATFISLHAATRHMPHGGRLVVVLPYGRADDDTFQTIRTGCMAALRMAATGAADVRANAVEPTGFPHPVAVGVRTMSAPTYTPHLETVRVSAH
jgi:hypothetical protein